RHTRFSRDWIQTCALPIWMAKREGAPGGSTELVTGGVVNGEGFFVAGVAVFKAQDDLHLGGGGEVQAVLGRQRVVDEEPHFADEIGRASCREGVEGCDAGA